MLEDADMSRFRLHIKENKRDYRNWLALGIVGLLLIAGSCLLYTSDITLVDTATALKNTAASNNVMIAIKKDGQFASSLPKLNAVEGAGKNFWLTDSLSGNYYMDADETNASAGKGKLEAKGTAGNSMTLKVYALSLIHI